MIFKCNQRKIENDHIQFEVDLIEHLNRLRDFSKFKDLKMVTFCKSHESTRQGSNKCMLSFYLSAILRKNVPWLLFCFGFGCITGLTFRLRNTRNEFSEVIEISFNGFRQFFTKIMIRTVIQFQCAVRHLTMSVFDC